MLNISKSSLASDEILNSCKVTLVFFILAMSCFITSQFCGDMRLGVREDRNKKFASTRRQNPLVLSQSAWVRLHAPFIRQHQQAEEQMHDDA